MKILELFILTLSISLIFSKTDSNKSTLSNTNLKKEKSKDIDFGDNPIHGVAVTNDNFILQHTAVINIFLLWLYHRLISKHKIFR